MSENQSAWKLKGAIIHSFLSIRPAIENGRRLYQKLGDGEGYGSVLELHVQ